MLLLPSEAYLCAPIGRTTGFFDDLASHLLVKDAIQQREIGVTFCGSYLLWRCRHQRASAAAKSHALQLGLACGLKLFRLIVLFCSRVKAEHRLRLIRCRPTGCARPTLPGALPSPASPPQAGNTALASIAEAWQPLKLTKPGRRGLQKRLRSDIQRLKADSGSVREAASKGQR